MMELEKTLENCNNFVEKLSKSPEQLFEYNQSFSSNIKSNLKSLYDYCKNQEVKSSKSNSLPELIIQNFDNEQIWQQIELQNDGVLANSLLSVGTLIAKKDSLKFKNEYEPITKLIESDGESDDEDSIEGDENTHDESADDNSEEEKMEIEEESGDETVQVKATNKPHKGSIVDDEFFKLHEMEEFLTAEEKKTNKDSGNEESDSDKESEDSINLFEEELDESEDSKARLAKYKEFFVPKEEVKKNKRNKFLDEFSEEEDNNNEQSTFEMRQNRLRQKISEIEDNAVSEKPWQLQGEIKADSRPQNSLLEEIVEFDRTSRPAPIITGQTTVQLEDIIKQRIKDKVFDSVERKVKPVESLLEYKKKLVLDQEKSKASLAQIYEKEFLDQQAALDPDNEDKEEEEPELHKEIKSMMNTLFHQLDALSNFHYTPKPAIPELKIISNLPAINMEEVAPVAASDAALLAPEEVKGKNRSNILGESEKTKTDKKRERRKKKLKQKHHAIEKTKREKLVGNVGIAKKYSKDKGKKLLEKVVKSSNTEKMDESSGRKGIKSSTTFFTQLQDQVKSQIKEKTGAKKKKTKVVHDAMKLKL